MNVFKARLIPVVVVLMLMLIAVVLRLFVVQVLHQDKYKHVSQRQSKRRVVLKAKRGCIRDRNGGVIAMSISKKIDLNKDVLLALAESKEESKILEDKRRLLTKRVYPFGELAGELVGYVGKDEHGLGGIEYAFDNVLCGENGWTIKQRDGRNNRYERMDMPRHSAIDGSDVYLTIDTDIQKIVERALSKKVEELNAKGGMCIVMNPDNGDILAMANYPGFNPNFPSQYSMDRRQNKCIGYNYEPGSTFKLITASAVLEHKLFKETDSLDGNQGVYEIYDQVIRDHKPYGMLSFKEVLSFSSNVCVAKMADKLGSTRLYSTIKDFGFGSLTGIGLPGEEKGVVHPISKWSGRTKVTMAIGQEISTTFLQMMMAYASMANGGLLLTPKVCDKIVATDGTVTFTGKTEVIRRVMSRNTAKRLRKMFKGVVEIGTGKKARISNISIAGKTGTSQKVDDDGSYSRKRVWASFIGLVPAEDPVLLCGVVIDEPETHAAGGLAAAPVFKEVINRIISNPELDYAEKILKENKKNKNVIRDSLFVPNFCGMNRLDAKKYLRNHDMKFDIIGYGAKIKHQSPYAGNLMRSDTRIVLYAVDNNSSENIENVSVPNCVGKDMRDAINALNVKGLFPYIKGSGIVHRQTPTVGTMAHFADVCTLYCSDER